MRAPDDRDDEEEENTNCLEGMKCPKCGSLGRFHIAGTATFLMSDDGCDETDGIEWEDASSCVCRACTHAATVADFKTKET